MFLSTFDQKHTNSKYHMTLLCVISDGFFPVACVAKCYQLHPSFIIHALAMGLGQICKLKPCIEEIC